MFLLPFHVVGCTHETNAAELIGSVRLSGEQIDDALLTLHHRNIPAVLLSTCHRTELYWWGDDDLAPWFSERTQQSRTLSLHVQRADADLAVRHLFAVAAGMRSARFGEPEILGQLRRAWTRARDIGTSHGEIDGAFRQAIDAARHIRAEMGDDGRGSLGDLVHAQLSSRIAETSTVLVVGAGDAARGVLQVLQQRPIPGLSVQITSRTDVRAAALASSFHCAVVPWDAREQAMRTADAVVFAVHVTSPLVTAAFGDSMPPRNRAATWIDLGVPCAVAPAFASSSVEMVTLATMEAEAEASLQEAPWRAEAQLRQRRAAVALQHELARYARATHRHSLGARLGALEAQAMAVAASNEGAPVDEMVRKVARLVLRELSRA